MDTEMKLTIFFIILVISILQVNANSTVVPPGHPCSSENDQACTGSEQVSECQGYELAAVEWQSSGAHYAAASGFKQIAECYEKLNNPTKAQEFYTKAAQEFELYAIGKEHTVDHELATRSFRQAAECYEKLNNPTKAQELRDKAPIYINLNDY